MKKCWWAASRLSDITTPVECTFNGYVDTDYNRCVSVTPLGKRGELLIKESLIHWSEQEALLQVLEDTKTETQVCDLKITKLEEQKLRVQVKQTQIQQRIRKLNG